MVLNLENEMIPIKTAHIGDRIEYSGDFGTVKYVGLVKGYQNIWLGIDWDNPTRGKHNGTVDGVNYFITSYPKSGSFVRPEKIQLGQTVLDAITSRYGQRDDEESARLLDEQLYCIQKSINAPFVKFVGFEKVTDIQSNFNNLEVVDLRLQNVKSLGDPSKFKALCPSITELDISKNLLTDWSTIFNICLQLKNLRWLNVSENLLTIPEDYARYNFPNLRVLICGTMRLNWSSILKLGRIFPNIEKLWAPYNNIKSLSTSHDDFPNLKMLDLEGNCIDDWFEINKLSVITSLNQMNLENTGVSKIYFDDTNMFRNLNKLVISNNLINDWQSIGELDKLSNLEDLRFLKNPILETENYRTCFQLIVARIANLKVCNGSDIKIDERKGAEYDYIKKYGLEWLSVKNHPENRAQFLQKHNRYEDLIQRHGSPEESELIVQSKIINISLIEVVFVHNEHSIVKKLLPTILIQKVIMLAHRLFNLPSRPSLIYVSNLKSQIKIKLDDEGKQLGFYSIQDGDKIIVKN